MYQGELLVDCCSYSPGEPGLSLVLTESSTGGLTRFRGKLQEVEAVNKNKRMYPRDVLIENVKRLNELVASRSLIGELDHPQDSIVHFANASHVITKLWWEGNVLMGEGDILTTNAGKCLKALIDDGVRIGMSSRGVGSGKLDENGILVIGESFRLITFDAVADPSTFDAFQEKIVGKKESYQPVFRTQHNSPKTVVKNEAANIHTVNPDLLVACLGGIFKQKTSNLISKIG